MILYDYFRSSAAYRVRIALNFKNVSYQRFSVNLLKGEQHSEDYRKLNPQRLVPLLETSSGRLTQSLAIIEYINETYPDPPLLSDDPWTRAKQRSMAHVIACDVHPLQNSRVLKYLRKENQSEPAIKMWIANWMRAGFETLEQQAIATPYLGGNTPKLPDILLVPQIYNAGRFEVSLDNFPKLCAIAERCKTLQPFLEASPDYPQGG